MSQSKQYHSKYKGVLVSSFTLKKFQSAIQKKRDELVQELADELSYIGEECVKIAREVGNYGDVTGNLRSSIGYEVLYNGKPVYSRKAHRLPEHCSTSSQQSFLMVSCLSSAPA